MLKIDQATIKFGGLTAVDNVSFEIEDNAIFGLIGPNGAGKTTLFNIISGVYAPTSGKIYLQDEDITGLQPYEICCKGIARTYQNINLFHSMTVMENVKIGCHHTIRSNLAANIIRTPKQRAEEKEIHEKCMELLEFVGLADKAEYQSKNLPYGEQRKLEIARAMATNPKLLLLDEPAAGMNSREKVDLAELIRKINERGMTILLVEQNAKMTLAVSDRAYVLETGRVVMDGTGAELLTNERVRSAYLGG